MTVFDDLHVRGLYVLEAGGILYVTAEEMAAIDASPVPAAALGFDVQVDDKKAAAQAKDAAKAVVLPVEPDLPGVSTSAANS